MDDDHLPDPATADVGWALLASLGLVTAMLTASTADECILCFVCVLHFKTRACLGLKFCACCFEQIADIAPVCTIDSYNRTKKAKPFKSTLRPRLPHNYHRISMITQIPFNDSQIEQFIMEHVNSLKTRQHNIWTNARTVPLPSFTLSVDGQNTAFELQRLHVNM